jgi:flagellar assembly factor FliW
MTPQNAAVEQTATSASVGRIDETGCVAIDTRFGTMRFDRESTVNMPRGLLGFTDFQEFGLCSLSGAGLDQFMLLQCMTNADLSFVVAPLNRDGKTIAEDDIAAACEALGVDMENVAVLLVVSTRRVGAATQISVNLRAPIIVDAQSRTAWQYVLLNNRYSVRELIGQAPRAA